MIFNCFVLCLTFLGNSILARKSRDISENQRYIETSKVLKLSWETAVNRCQAKEMELCLKKDICHLVDNSYKIRRANKVASQNHYVPILDEYNDWLYIGPRKLHQCRRITELFGPPYWQGRNCSNLSVGMSSKKIQNFCLSDSGIFCCAKNETSQQPRAHPVPVYVRSRVENGLPYYSFSLMKSYPKGMYAKDRAAWRNAARISGDLSIFTLMSHFVQGRFENPIFFCKRTTVNENGLTTTLHSISDTWCASGWRLNFYLYGSLSQPLNERPQQLFVSEDETTNLGSSRVSTETNSPFTSKFTFYAPTGNENNEIELASMINDACKNETETITSSNGVINSPNFPGKYPQTICKWRILAPQQSVIRLTFKFLKLSPGNASVAHEPKAQRFLPARLSKYNFNKVCRGERIDIAGFGIFCGDKLPPSFVTIHNEVFITFYGRNFRKTTGRGFSIFFQTISPSNGLTLSRVSRERQQDFTWSRANRTCSDEGKRLCRAADICRFDRRPFYGVSEGDQWVPISNEYNDWIQIGRGNVHTCTRHNRKLGPPLWGTVSGVCDRSNITHPCPGREYLYCCDGQGPPFAQHSREVVVLIYTTVQNNVVFSKYLRQGIDNAASFDNVRIWTPRQKKRGDFTAIKLRSAQSRGYSKVVYFCQREVIPKIERLTHSYAMLLQPCESRGWKFLYYLYAMNFRKKGAIRYFVGISEKTPHHSRLHAQKFPEGFQDNRGYVLFAFGARGSDTTVTNKETEQSACNGDVLTLEAPAILESPGYPMSYEKNTECKWHVKMPMEDILKGNRLRVTIEELSLEDPVDILSISEFEEKDSTEFSSENQYRRDITGTVGQVSFETTKSFLLVFKSDNSVSKKGFRIKSEIVSRKCGGHITADGHRITSPSYPKLYPSNIDCEWYIEAPSENYDIELYFESFDLATDGNCSDSISIISDSENVFCQSSKPNGSIPVNGSHAKIHFKSTSPNRRRNGKGFSLKVAFVESKREVFPQCGLQTVPFEAREASSDRIIEGTVAEEGNLPWMVQVTGPTTFCGGTLVSNKRVLTATHCMIRKMFGSIAIFTDNPTKIRIILGRHRRNIPSPGEQIFKMLSLSFRGDYAKMAKVLTADDGSIELSVFSYNDIFMIELSEKVSFSPTIQPICLPSQDTFVGDTCYVAGWGSLDVAGNIKASAARYAKAPILDNSLCNTFPKMEGTVLRNSLCAGYPEGGPGMCWGDSGGPLFCRGRHGNFYINGIVSWSIGCGGKNAPGVYVRLWNFYDWMMEILEKDAADDTST